MVPIACLWLFGAIATVTLCHAAPDISLPLAIEQRVQVQLNTSAKAGRTGLQLSLCGGSRCNVVVVTGVSAEPRMGYTISTIAMDSPGKLWPGTFIPGRKHTFIVNRKTDQETEIWLEGDPGHCITLTSNSFSQRLEVTSTSGPVKLIKEGPIRLSYDTLPVGRSVRLRLEANGNGGYLYFGVCKTGNCAFAKIQGVTKKPHIYFGTSYWQGAVPTSHTWESVTADDEYDGIFTAGVTYNFVLHRRSTTYVDFWEETGPAYNGSLSINSDNDQLLVYSRTGAVTFV